MSDSAKVAVPSHPFLDLVKTEAGRLADGFIATTEHLASVIGETAGSPAFQAKLDAFCADAGLVARAVGEAILFIKAVPR